MKTKHRVVAAVVHHDSNEVEIITETTINVGSLNERCVLNAIWVDCESEISKREIK